MNKRTLIQSLWTYHFGCWVYSQSRWKFGKYSIGAQKVQFSSMISNLTRQLNSTLTSVSFWMWRKFSWLILFKWNWKSSISFFFKLTFDFELLSVKLTNKLTLNKHILPEKSDYEIIDSDAIIINLEQGCRTIE